MMTAAAKVLCVSLVGTLAFTAAARERAAAEPSGPAHSMLPSPGEAKALLDTTHHHGEWVRVPTRSGRILAAVTYPDRPDGAAVVVITATDQKLSPWLRAVADQVTSEGFIAVVPDAFAGAVTDVAAVRHHVLRHPASNGRSANITISTSPTSSTIDIDTHTGDARFQLSKASWPAAMAFLNTYSDNDRRTVVKMPSHAHLLNQQAQTGRAQGPRGYPVGKLDNLPAGLFTAKGTLLRSSLRSEWVDIPTPGIYTGKMRTRITYPQGTARAGIVVVMQHGPGMDEWMQSVGDQLSRDGFIALVPDLHTGMGRSGGGYESFDGPDAAFAANANLRPEVTTAAYKAVREYGMTLARANGKSAAIGFCMGGGQAWLLASEVPDLSAAVVYYGTHPADEASFAKVKAPIIGFFGEDDARVTATIIAASATATKLGKSFETHVYPHATHGFLEFQDLGGNGAATLDSWTRTVAFLKQHAQ
jgi:carboxymethylenebutenolidase